MPESGSFYALLILETVLGVVYLFGYSGREWANTIPGNREYARRRKRFLAPGLFYFGKG